MRGEPFSSAEGRRADSISLLRITIVGFSLLDWAIQRGLAPIVVVVVIGSGEEILDDYKSTGGNEANPRTSGARILRETNGTG